MLLPSHGEPILESWFVEGEGAIERLLGDAKNDFSCGATRENVGGKRVLPVRLGKFRSLNLGGENEEPCQGESSGCKLDERRCYSMGSLQYVVGDSNLQVALSLVSGHGGGGGNSARSGDVEGQKITSRARGESFSVSKIWLWSKKAKYPNSSETSLGA
ncbi:RING-H2 finger protein ATL47 [Camellia lanceoleosa]|uniref:RING-H2 finger protein ATL47 n=1 Tax=Camellia lanceoleosa TaxID=1840588 RepID=A0ACC0I3K0_9ERIC|nr:RING-H2 finger protein ATL47 [Camellia lanceoleosa]